MPVYNVAPYVAEAIGSILGQSVGDFELIIVNDGSTDGTASAVREFGDSRVTLIDHADSKGNYPRRNEGMRRAKGEYIAVMDGDDVAHPQRFEKQLAAFAAAPELLACGTFFRYMGYAGEPVIGKPTTYAEIRRALRSNMCFLHPSMMVRRDTLLALGGYDERYRYAADYDLACRLALAGKVCNLPEALMWYRLRGGQISSAHRGEQKKYADEIEIKYKSQLTMIPKIIHYCWFNKDHTDPLPEKVQRCVASWRKHCPDWEIKLWNEDNFNVKMNGYTREAYGAGKMAFVSDYARMYLLYTYGGVYLDADVELLQPLDALLDNPAFTGIENVHDASIGWIGLGTAALGAEVGNPWVKAILDYYANMHFIKSDGSLNMLISNHIHGMVTQRLYGLNDRGRFQSLYADTHRYGDVTVYGKEVLYPHDASHITPGSYAIHHCEGSWVTPVSVVMAVHNGAEYIREAIASVLGQTFGKFEFIIVDNASTDDTVAIVNSYKSNKIRLLRRDVNDLSAALNDGIRAAAGKYIARIDADDAMLPARLSRQYAVMERYPAAVVCTSSYHVRNGSNPPHATRTLREGFVENPAGQLECGNIVAHPTVMLRKEFLQKNSLKYEGYPRAEDYKLWTDIARRGGGFYAVAEPLTTYRCHAAMTSCMYAEEQRATAARVRREAAAYRHPASELAVVIPFCNEGDEVWRTIFSLRGSCSRNVQVVLVNDASTDGYDYESVARATGSRYILNAERKGVAESREVGVAACQTPYFMLLDAHCKFYQHGWDEALVRLLRDNPRSVACCRTKFLWKNRDCEMPDKPTCWGAHFNGDVCAAWSVSNPTPGVEPAEVPCLLGGAYVSSKEYWQRLHGLSGLREYGRDEEFISLKVHAEGGRVLCAGNVVVGHVFRDKFPYATWTPNVSYNQLLIAELLTPPEVKEHMLAVNAGYYKGAYEAAKKLAGENAAWIAQEKEYLRSIFPPNWEDAICQKTGQKRRQDTPANAPTTTQTLLCDGHSGL
jgi:glycosyltransferase involved in cell wall biosynthesis